jgi:hypothetical protein
VFLQITLLLDDDRHQMSIHLGVHIIKVYFKVVLLLFVKHTDHTSSNLPNFIVYPDKVGISTVCPLAVVGLHLLNMAEHGCYQDVIRLVNLPEVKKLQEYDVLKYSILLAKVTFLEHFEHGLYEYVDPLQNGE